jgi:hypothetical protein
MNKYIVFNKKIQYIIFISLLITLLFLFIIWKRFDNYLPKSEIKYKQPDIYYKFYIEKIEDGKLFRKFNVLDDTLKDEINEIFSHKHIPWKKNIFYSPIHFFKNFDCTYYKQIPKRRIDPFTLIYFPENSFKWNDECFLHEQDTNNYYFPEPNSIIYHHKELIWKGPLKINIVMGKKIN